MDFQREAAVQALDVSYLPNFCDILFSRFH
jgi:hypothetical protein